MPSRKKKTTKFVAMWDMHGLEYLGNITTWEQDVMWSTLKGEKPTIKLPGVNLLIMRARYNMQRHYEIYLFETVDMDEAYVLKMFAECPQVMVDSIRKQGHKIYSDRLEQDDRVIV
jgi:hypothetical protein